MGYCPSTYVVWQCQETLGNSKSQPTVGSGNQDNGWRYVGLKFPQGCKWDISLVIGLPDLQDSIVRRVCILGMQRISYIRLILPSFCLVVRDHDDKSNVTTFQITNQMARLVQTLNTRGEHWGVWVAQAI